MPIWLKFVKLCYKLQNITHNSMSKFKYSRKNNLKIKNRIKWSQQNFETTIMKINF